MLDKFLHIIMYGTGTVGKRFKIIKNKNYCRYDRSYAHTLELKLFVIINVRFMESELC